MTFTINRRACLKTAFAGGALLAGLPARAEPSGVVYGFSPGSGVFPVMAQLLKHLHGRYMPDLGMKMTYMPGNVGARAMESILKSAPDGGTVLAAPSGLFTLVPQFRKPSDNDLSAELVPVIAFAETTLVLAVGPLVPASVKSVADFVAWLRENPLHASYGVQGMGTEGHLLGISVAKAAGITFKPLAYKGEQPLVQDMLDSALAAGVFSIGTAGEAYRDGSLRRLAVSSADRWPAAPLVPTLQELGLSDFSVEASFGLFASSRMAPAKQRELRDAVTAALGTAPVTAAVTEVLMRQVSANQMDYPAALARERARWTAHIGKHRLTLDS